MTNEEILWQECNKIGRFLTIPGIYRHFKQSKNGEDMIYCLNGYSVPSTVDFLNAILKDNTESEILYFNHTELEEEIPVVRIANKYYHLETTEKEVLPIYTALYGDRDTYVRPLSMFLSKTDKEKYPNANQKYRLELISSPI